MILSCRVQFFFMEMNQLIIFLVSSQPHYMDENQMSRSKKKLFFLVLIYSYNFNLITNKKQILYSHTYSSTRIDCTCIKHKILSVLYFLGF